MSDRWRRLLAVALVIESAAGFAPWISAVHPPNWYLEIPSWVYHGWSVLAMNGGGMAYPSEVCRV